MLSQGPFSYNRFDEMDAIYQKVYESKKAKPDFLDVDKDGNKKESFKKAVKDDKASGKSVEESDDKKDLPPFMKDKKGDKKGDKKDKCDCKEDVIGYLMHEGFANNSVSAEVLFNHMSDQWLESIEEKFEQINEFTPAPAGSPIDRHSRGISKYDQRSERQIKMDNFASKRSKMMNQPKTP